MTRPVRPASAIAEVRGARKSVESLAKRPAPPQSAGFEWGLARFTTDQTVSTGTGTALDVAWDEIFVPTGQAVITRNTNTALDNTFPFTLTGTAIVTFGLRIDFLDSNWTDFRRLRIGDGVGYPDPIMEQEGDGAGQGGALLLYASPVYVDPGGAVAQNVRVRVEQNSGSNKTVGSGTFLVALLSPVTSIVNMTPFVP